ncbi:MAG: restriction endonuclease [Proteobacteria bacterium]|nr:restriction endonuclease [Pseudomonadota bacterium]
MADSQEKGKILEDVVALLHELPGVKVETRVKLPSVRTGSTREREVDVLLTSQVAGYAVKIAIECKNYKERVESEKIDCFLGKLDDIGIPPVNGIFVTATGYRKDALELAQESGIRALVLEGLNQERLKLEVSAAIQSVVFHLARWDAMSRFSDVSSALNFPPPITVMDFPEELGQGSPKILNFLYLLWQQNKISSDLGIHHLAIRMPQEFRFSENEPPMQNALVILAYEVSAYVGAMTGTSSAAFLRNAVTQTLEKVRIDAQFEDPPNSIQLSKFGTEETLEEFLGESGLRIVTRIKVPRIESQMSFWPPSKRALEEIMKRRQAGEDPTFEEIEGSVLNTAWEPSIFDEEK